MGDRRNVIIKDDPKKVGVALYSHWGGSALPGVLRSALVRGLARWNDAPYLARIIFCEMVRGAEMGETGFGISAGDDMCEASDIDIEVDVAGQRLRLGKGKPWSSFSEFIKGVG